MNICIYGWYFLPLLVKSLEEEGHSVILNKFSSDVDVFISETRITSMYDAYLKLKDIKKNRIKLINFIAEVPIPLLYKAHPQNNMYRFFLQTLFHITHKDQFLLDRVNYFTSNPEKSKIYNILAAKIQWLFNTNLRNRLFLQNFYRTYLKHSDLNLSISIFTQKLVKRFLKLESEVCYPCVNSNYLLNLPKVKIEYDAINISRIVHRKRQYIFSKAAEKLGLNALVLGRYSNRDIKLHCPHFYYKDRNKVLDILNKTAFYVDASIMEGFGMTPVEALFLDKPVIASNTFVHNEVLGNAALYFEPDNVDDLVEKMKIIIEGNYQLETSKIKEQFSIPALKNRLMAHIESLY